MYCLRENVKNGEVEDMKNKIVKNLISVIAACLVALSLVVPTFAQNEEGTLILTLKSHDEPVLSGTIAIYHVADLKDSEDFDRYEFTDEFKNCNLNIEDLNNTELPKMLCDYIKGKSIDRVIKGTDTNGQVVFNNLDEGLYLVAQDKVPNGYSSINPFLVEIPSYNEASKEFEYKVYAEPKITPDDVTVPTEPETEEIYQPTRPETGKLPHTGQLNWPIPVLAFAGVVLFIIGFSVYYGGKKK